MKTKVLFVSLAFCLLASAVFAADEPLRIIVFGAHPDDCELDAGGTAAKWAKQGHKVKFVSVTNGDIGHSVIAGGPLATLRTEEVKCAAKALGIETEVLDNHDGELMPTLENRREIIRQIRRWQADIVIAPRTNDYHPDHRYTGVLVQDAAYMVTVPFICPDVPYLTKNPVFLYTADGFQKPNPFEPNVVVGIDDVWPQKLEALHCLGSQFYEFGANGEGKTENFITGTEEEQKKWLEGRFAPRYRPNPKWAGVLEKFYGKEAASQIQKVEAFELCEYGRQPNEEEWRQLFPFFDGK